MRGYTRPLPRQRSYECCYYNNVLRYHVWSGALSSADVSARPTPTALSHWLFPNLLASLAAIMQAQTPYPQLYALFVIPTELLKRAISKSIQYFHISLI